MSELGLRNRSGPFVEEVMRDPAASFALKAVLRSWGERDLVDAALDAQVLSEVFEAELARRFREIT